MEYKIENEFEQRPLIFDNRIGKRYVSVKSLAIYLDVSECTIRDWIRKRIIPFKRIGKSNSIRFDLKDIDSWIGPLA